MITKKEFFKFAATMLLMPGGLLLAAALAVVIALVLGMVIYGALIFGALRWTARGLRSLLFGKAAPTNGRESIPPCSLPAEGSALPEDFDAAYEAEWKRREAARWKWLQ